MPTLHGQFTWFDLMTTDLAAATDFYRTVIGWSATDAGMADRSYTVLAAGDVPVGGIMPLPPEAPGMTPVWRDYMAVDDVDAAAAKARALGGAVHVGPQDIPGVGRFAVAADPQGAVFILFKGMSATPDMPPPGGAPGHVGWHELRTSDPEAAIAFYAALLDWTKSDALDMGPMGIYQMFATPGTPAVGGIMAKPDAPPHWLQYVNVEAIQPAVARVQQAGGTLLNGPMEVPGGHRVAQCRDPQGGMFAMVGPG
jgi:predicted enzyme related to lactoylglutathione lyase